jgi:hypothetical protein
MRISSPTSENFFTYDRLLTSRWSLSPRRGDARAPVDAC